MYKNGVVGLSRSLIILLTKPYMMYFTVAKNRHHGMGLMDPEPCVSLLVVFAAERLIDYCVLPGCVDLFGDPIIGFGILLDS